MKPFEMKVGVMYTRFPKIVNVFKSLWKTFLNEDLVREVLRSLLLRFNSKAAAIVKSYGLSHCNNLHVIIV
ncbi:hypothetical protein KSP40_PGU009832 [Platanthera guangdongensis]|uniref:Uncharacterized protein n=1 Tax=Platanthera guangdongensis TaxID=2320717 RepID=A0ABR2N0Z3_9ASPA